MVLTQQTAASSVSLTTTQSNLAVANVNLTTSGTGGNQKIYHLNITSQYGGLRNTAAVTKGASSSSATIPYSLNWATTTGSVTSSTVLTINSTAGQTIMTKNKAGGSNSLIGNIQLSLTGASAASLYSGSFTDTITVVYLNTTDSTSITSTFTLTSAVVADTITITVTPTATASNLPLNISQSQLNVGSISITANCQNGYTLSLSSSNSGILKHSSAGASPASNEKINYTLYYQGSQVSASSSPVTVATSSSATLLTTTTQIGSVGISYTGVVSTSMKSGSYQDYLTFTLQSQ